MTDHIAAADGTSAPTVAQTEDPAARIDTLIASFLAAVRQKIGSAPAPDEVVPGAIIRYDTPDDRPGRKTGWAIFRVLPSGIACGRYGEHRYGRRGRWISTDVAALAPEQAAQLQAELEAQARAWREERERAQREAAEDAARRWAAAPPAADDHPYLRAHGVRAHGLRREGAQLIVPVRDIEGHLWSVQRIPAEPGGRKRFLSGGRVQGCMCWIDDAVPRDGDPIIVAEGWATAAAVREATRACVAATFSARNLARVTRLLRERYPSSRIIVAGDRDANGVGQRAAYAAARAVRGWVAIPSAEDLAALGRAQDSAEPVGDADWADVYGNLGADAVVDGIRAARFGVAGGDRRLRPSVVVRAGERSGAVELARELLRTSGLPLFLRDRQVVRIARAATDPDGVPVIAPVTIPWVQTRLAELAEWRKPVERRGDVVLQPLDPPRPIVEAILDAPDELHLRPLHGIATAPIIAMDGSVETTPGYHADTGLWLHLPDPDAWRAALAAHPTREDARRAVDRFRELLRHFPFASEVDFGVVMSAVVTAVLRPVLPTAPAFALDAPAAGTGKTLLAETIGMIGTGAIPAVTEIPTRDEDEGRKRIDAAMLAGAPVILIDNVEGTLGSAALCQALTQTSRRIRPLGRSEEIRVPSRGVWMITGNNLGLRGDLTRRVLLARLDARIDRPERRRIDQDLQAEVRARRVELAAALIDLVRAYLLAGCPPVTLAAGRDLGSFRAWLRTVRAAVVWAGCADPVEAAERVQADDPVRRTLEAVLRVLWYTFRGRPVTVREILGAAEPDADLAAALEQAVDLRGPRTSRRLAAWLRQHRDRIVGTLQLVQAPGRAGVSRWAVVSTLTAEAAPAQECREAGAGDDRGTGADAEDAEVPVDGTRVVV